MESRVPYKHLKQAEVELVDPSGSSEQRNHDSFKSNEKLFSSDLPRSSLKTLILASMVAAGVQFGWALQLSLLTPYIQTLGIGHAFSSFIWICGPITGLVVQPCVGVWSDRCHLPFGRRRPFIFIGSLMICVAVVIIGFAADIGYLLGDTKEHCRTYKGPRTRASIVFVIGFWMLDLANNTVQGPARALLADLSGSDQKNSANAIFCSWMAVGNILGYSAGASGAWHRLFPFLMTHACCEACGNLKAAFLVAVIYLTFCTVMTLYFAKEIPLVHSGTNHLHENDSLMKHSQESALQDAAGLEKLVEKNNMVVSSDQEKKINENHCEVFLDGPGDVLVNFLTSMRHLPPAMFSVLIVTFLSWLSWFPFFLFDTDWMGREVYHGNPNGDASEVSLYGKGVREGAFGLLLNSAILGFCSFFVEPLCRWMGSRRVWAMSNFMVFLCMGSTAMISIFSIRRYSEGIEGIIVGNVTIKMASLIVFALLGIPLSITYSVPFSLTAELTADAGGGQGLAIGVLNLAIVIPQIIVSLGAGPWDALFGGGNMPAFVVASLFALAASIVAFLKLPDTSSGSCGLSSLHFG